MPTNITDSSTFSDPVQIPADGDAVNSAAELLSAQSLANRTRYLKNQIELVDISAGEFNYRTPAVRLITVPFLAMRAAGSHLAAIAYDPATGVRYWALSSTNTVFLFPITLPKGSTLATVSAKVGQGTAGAPGQMTLKVWKQDDTAVATPATQLGATNTAPAGTGTQNLVVSGLSEVGVDGFSYWGQLVGGSGAPSDAVYSAQFILSAEKGVRNSG